jgi:hypothetical protein
MKQSRLNSWLESIANTSVGFGISLVAQIVFLPMLGVEIAFHQNLIFALIMTAISIVRGYAMRRVFEHFGIRTKLSPFVQAVVAERRRQIDVEGWSIEHDDAHERGALALAGACYAATVDARASLNKRDAGVAAAGFDTIKHPRSWPWSWDWWKPQDDRRDLVRACALIVAEGEKLDRNRKRKGNA